MSPPNADGRHPGRVISLAALSVPHPQAFTQALISSSQAARSWYMAAYQLPWLPERVLGRHRVGANLGNERDIFARRETRDEIVGLENKADGVAAKLREARFIGAAEIPAAVEQGAARG